MKPVTAQSHRPQNQRRLTYLAVLTAILIHAVLVVLFRYSPATAAPTVGDLPAVEVLDVRQPGNKQLVLWLRNHNPALLTQSDPEFSYSRILQISAPQSAVEDLPRPPQLTQPRPAGNTPAVTGNLPVNFRNNAAVGFFAPSIERRTVQIVLNGKTDPGLARELGYQLKLTPPVKGQYPQSGLTILSWRRSYSNIQMETIQSCGSSGYDQLAANASRRYLSGRNDIDDGVITVEWGGGTAPAPASEVKK